MENLHDFLQDQTVSFVEQLFEAVRTKSYLVNRTTTRLPSLDDERVESTIIEVQGAKRRNYDSDDESDEDERDHKRRRRPERVVLKSPAEEPASSGATGGGRGGGEPMHTQCALFKGVGGAKGSAKELQMGGKGHVNRPAILNAGSKGKEIAPTMLAGKGMPKLGLTRPTGCKANMGMVPNMGMMPTATGGGKGKGGEFVGLLGSFPPGKGPPQGGVRPVYPSLLMPSVIGGGKGGLGAPRRTLEVRPGMGLEVAPGGITMVGMQGGMQGGTQGSMQGGKGALGAMSAPRQTCMMPTGSTPMMIGSGTPAMTPQQFQLERAAQMMRATHMQIRQQSYMDAAHSVIIGGSEANGTFETGGFEVPGIDVTERNNLHKAIQRMEQAHDESHAPPQLPAATECSASSSEGVRVVCSTVATSAGGGKGAKGDATKGGTSGSTVHVGNIPSELLDLGALNSHFKQFGRVVNILIKAEHRRAVPAQQSPPPVPPHIISPATLLPSHRIF